LVGSRDPATSALNVVIGRRTPMDVVRVTSWKPASSSPTSSSSSPSPSSPTSSFNPPATSSNQTSHTPSEPTFLPNLSSEPTDLASGQATVLASVSPLSSSPDFSSSAPASPSSLSSSPSALSESSMTRFQVGADSAAEVAESAQPAKAEERGDAGGWVERREIKAVKEGVAEASRKEDEQQQMECDVRYAASFFGYGFYGAVTKESEALRWMGPARYDYAGFMTYMRHRSYEAEVSFFHVPEPDQPSMHRRSTTPHSEICTVGCSVCANGQDLSLLARSALGFEAIGPSQSAVGLASLLTPLNRTDVDTAADTLAVTAAAGSAADAAAFSPSYQPPPVSPTAAASAATAAEADKHRVFSPTSPPPPSTTTATTTAIPPTVAAYFESTTECSHNSSSTTGQSPDADVAVSDSAEPLMWDDATPGWRTVRGRFHSVGGAVISCRNDKAPDGVAAHAHLADGNLNLIMIRECSRAEYLQQLLCLAIKGADPLDFHFVQHHKTPAFTFKAMGEQGFWNVDGELVEASELSAQVFRGMVDMFGSGPDV
ncbi:unnamed protein product, partial [Closterium sp. NIES-54]